MPRLCRPRPPMAAVTRSSVPVSPGMIVSDNRARRSWCPGARGRVFIDAAGVCRDVIGRELTARRMAADRTKVG